MSEALIFVSTNPQYDNRFPLNWGEYVVYRNCFWHSEHFLYTTCSPHVLILEFSCIELVIQLNEQSVVILWVIWCKNKSFWQRFTCTWFSNMENHSAAHHCLRIILVQWHELFTTHLGESVFTYTEYGRIWICKCILFYRREFWASKSAGANSI